LFSVVDYKRKPRSFNFKEFENKRPLPVLRNYHSIRLEGLRDIEKLVTQDSWRSGWDLKVAPSKYKKEALPFDPNNILETHLNAGRCTC
jgi:hypothetical protein